MRKIISGWSLFLSLTLTLLAGCGSDSKTTVAGALSPDNVNLIFVVTPDLKNNSSGDVNPVTANLTSQGLNRSLQMASYLKQQLLGGAQYNPDLHPAADEPPTDRKQLPGYGGNRLHPAVCPAESGFAYRAGRV